MQLACVQLVVIDLRCSVRRGARYLVDEVETPPGIRQYEARTVVFSSPKRSNFHSFLKAIGATIRFMPPWSWQEIADCHAALYSTDATRPLALVEAAYRQWGGIPRYVLEKLCDKAAQQELISALASSDLAAVRNAVGAIDSASDASHRLLHIETQKPYVERTIAFGSAYIADQVIAALAIGQRQQLLSFLEGTAHSGDVFGPQRGVLFEAYAHRVLRSGGTFLVRRLGAFPEPSEGGSETLTLARSDVVELLKQASDLRNCKAGAYAQPATTRFPAVDAVKLPAQLFQITVSASHSIKHAALDKVLAALPTSLRYDLFFVVPEDLFAAFRAQSYVGADKTVITRLSPLVQCVQQWALCLPLHGRAGVLAGGAAGVTGVGVVPAAMPHTIMEAAEHAAATGAAVDEALPPAVASAAACEKVDAKRRAVLGSDTASTKSARR